MLGGHQDQQMAYAGQMLVNQSYFQPESEDEKRKNERREKRLKMMEKKAHQEVGYDETTAQVIMGVGACNALVLMVCLIGGAWKYRAFRGFGMKTLTLSTGLLRIDIEFECGKNWVEDKVCGFFEMLNGRHSLMEFTNLSCMLGETPCRTMKSVYYGSFIVFLTFSVAIALQLAGVLFMHFYWYRSPLHKVRQWAVAFMTAGPCLAVAGIGGWAFLTPDLGDLPRGWAALMSSYTGNAIISYHALSDLEYGWTFFLAIITIIGTATAVVIVLLVPRLVVMALPTFR